MLMLVLVALPACKKAPKQGAQPSATHKASPSPAKPVPCPLTGQDEPRGFDRERPALAVKIENAPAARPQAGLEAADVVYEELAEGGITRFMAIFYCSDASRLEPIRSARFVDSDILREYAPVLFAYAGAAGPVQDKVKSTPGVTDLRHGTHGDAYHRDKARKGPHNLYSSTAELRGLKDAKDVQGAPKTGLRFEEPTPAGAGPSPSPSRSATASASASASAAPGSSVQFSFGGGTPSKYVFDPGTGRYLRFHGAEPHRSVSGDQIKVTNVVVLKVQVRPGTIRDAAGNISPDTTVIGSGDAIVLSGGKAVNGRWNRPGLTDRTTITDAAGQTIKLRPGNTWIHLVPATQQVSVQ